MKHINAHFAWQNGTAHTMTCPAQQQTALLPPFTEWTSTSHPDQRHGHVVDSHYYKHKDTLETWGCTLDHSKTYMLTHRGQHLAEVTAWGVSDKRTILTGDILSIMCISTGSAHQHALRHPWRLSVSLEKTVRSLTKVETKRRYGITTDFVHNGVCCKQGIRSGPKTFLFLWFG